MVPPTQKPSVLICFAGDVLHLADGADGGVLDVLSPGLVGQRLVGLRQLTTKTRWPCSTVYRISELSGCRSMM